MMPSRLHSTVVPCVFATFLTSTGWPSCAYSSVVHVHLGTFQGSLQNFTELPAISYEPVKSQQLLQGILHTVRTDGD